MSTVLRRWRPLAAVAAAVTAFILVPQGVRAGAVPLTPGVIDPSAGTIVRWSAAADGSPLGFFQQCSGFGSRSAVVQVTGGTGEITKAPGATAYPDITCTRAISSDDPVYAWRSIIEQGDADDRAVVLSALDAEGVPVQIWDLFNAWPSQYIQAFDRVVVVFTHDRASLRP